MKKLHLSFLLFFLLINTGCDSDTDLTRRPDNSAIKPFIDLGANLNDYLWAVNFGRIAHIPPDTATAEETADFEDMLRDTELQNSYCNVVYDILLEFDLLTVSNKIFTDSSRDSTIILNEGIFTLATQYISYFETPNAVERLNAVMTYNPADNRWLLKIYQGTTDENLWLIQEGEIIGNTWYATLQRINGGIRYKANYMVTDSSTPSNVILRTSGEESASPVAQGTLFSDGITETNDEWSEFKDFELIPDYEFTP